MAQTDYSNQPAPGIPGQLSTTAYQFVTSRNNENAGQLSCGIFVKQGVATKGMDLLGAVTDTVIGIILKSDAHSVYGLTGTNSIDVKSDGDVLEEGGAWVNAEVAMVPTDPVYVRFAAGSGTQIGAVRKDSDSNTCRLLKGARVLGSGTSAKGQVMANVWYSRAANQAAGVDDVEISAPIASVSATTTTVIAKSRADRQLVIDGVDYLEPATGIAQSDTNYYVLTLQVGGTVIATYSTKLTGGNGPITAGTFAAFVMSALANTVLPPGSVISLVETLTGALTAPAGTLFVHAHYA